MSDKVPSILSGSPRFTSKIPIIKPNFDLIKDSALEKLDQILSSNMVTGVNQVVKEFEKTVSQYFSKNIIAVSSCTMGMVLAMNAMGLRGKEVIMPSFSFSATAHMAYWNNCTPVFCDIDKETLNIDVASAESMITENTGAILAVHMYGNPAPIDELEALASKYGIKILYDAAHAFGSKYRGTPVANFGDAVSFSLSPTKVLSTIEGGLVATRDDNVQHLIDVLRNYGNYPDYTCPLPGVNARMSELYAAIGLEFMEYIDEFIQNRNRYAQLYEKLLGDIPGLSFQKVDPRDTSTYKDFSIFVDTDEFGIDRNTLSQALLKAGISTKFYFYPPMHQLDPYKDCKTSDLSVTNWATNSVLSLPIWNIMEEEVIEGIAEEIRLCNEHSEKVKENNS